MRDINLYIDEKLSVDRFTKVEKPEIKFKPKSKRELSDIIYSKILDDNDANLNDIDVSEITDMSNLFYNYQYNMSKYVKNIDISYWDVSNVKDMDEMFRDCEDFNCDLSDWNVSNCTSMFGMFFGCKNFESNLVSWDVSNCKSFKSMFYGCEKFNSDLSKWDVSKCGDFRYMFAGCTNFTADLNSWDIEDMDTSFMFRNSGIYKKRLPKWFKKK